MKRMVIPFLAAFVFFMSSFDKAQAVTLDKPHDFTCATCHTPHKTLASTGYNNICLNCHRGGDPMAGAKSFAPGDAADPFNIYTSGISNRYQISHRWDGADVNARAGATAPTQAQMTSVRGRTSGAMACVRCHNPHSQANKPFLRTANSTDQMCTDCHNSRNQTDHKTGTHPVGIDYSAFANLSAFKATPENANPSNSTSAMKLVGGKILCSTCHSVHATDSNSATFDSFSTLSDLQPSDGNLLRTDRRAATVDGLNICTNCHAKKVAHNGRGQNVQCTDCHGAHVDTGDGSVPNVWLVKRDMGAGKGVVQFTSTTVKNYMDTTSSNGVCQSCHAVPTGAGFQFHLTETNATCNNCHTHGNSKGAFTVDATGACNSCHGYPPLLNSAGTGGYAAGYNATTSFVDESTSGHVSHVSSPYQKACSSCHSGNSHVTGTYQDVFVGTDNYNKTTRTCSNVYCHSNANPRGVINPTFQTTPSWDGAKGKIIGTAGECGACHSAAGDPSPSWSVSHTKHINGYAANAKFNCNACHAKTAASNAAIFSNMTARSLHTNGVKDVAFNSFAGGGSWDSGSATCSNLYCHSNVQGVNGTGAPTTFTAATWNGAAMTCGSCHASMTTDIATVTGNHKLHVQGYGFDCSTCHGAGYSATGNTAPVATHVDGSISMSLTGKAAINGATPSYYQGNNAPGNGFASCSNIYCHSNVQGSGGVGSPTSYAAPVWGAGAVACGSCHANMATSGAATGSHIKHAQNAGYSCVTCHNGAGKDPNPPYAVTAKHANGSIDVAFSGSAVGTAYSKGATVVPGAVAGYGSCSNAVCHANPYGSATVTTPVWGVSAGCAACHSGSGAFGAYSAPVTGSHVKHIAGTGVLCNQCHVGAVKGANGGTAHANGVVNVDVALGYYSSSIIKHASGTYAVNATCSTAVCHSDPYSANQAISPVWGTSSGCESCHNNGGAFTGTGNGPATGSHNKHMATTVSCGDCHSGAVVGTNGGLSHANGVVNVTQGYYSSSVSKHAAGTYSANAKCSTACHSPYTTPVTTPAWGTASSCSSCHDSAPTTGSHGFHLNRFAGCTDCHGALSDVNGGADHLNGSINVTNGYPVTSKHAAGTGYTGTCSTTSCHPNPYGTGSAVTPIWGAASGCSACHTTAIGINGPATGSHTTVAGHAVACINCHAADTTATVAPGTGHADGDIDVANVGYLTLNKTKGTAGTTCSAATCHPNVYGTGSAVTPAWGTTGNGCTACHTTPIGVNGPATGSHAAHAGSACISCHNAGTTATTVPASGHADGNIDIVGVGYPADKIKGSAGTTCSAASCHTDPYATTGAIVTPAWGTTGAGCAACHTGANAITATGPATGSHALTGHAAACISCHAAGTTQTTVPSVGHADGNIDVANVGYPVDKIKGSAGTTCSAASCHASPVAATLIVTPAWGTTGAGCAACHTGANTITATGPATGSHALTGHAAACVSCHAAGTTQTTVPSVGHADGNIDVANVGYPVDKIKGSAGTTCSTASCHASPVAATLVVTPAWGTTGAGCAACHTGVNAITATGPATGSHALTGHAAACVSCHAAGTTQTTVPSVGHADGNIDVANVGYPVNKIKGSAGTTCSAASCHASPVDATIVVTPAWGTTGAGCAACHTGANAITATGPATGSHTAIAGHAVACITCHAAGTTATTVPSTGHADGNIDVANVGYATLNKTKGTAGVNCSTAICHGSITPAWGVHTSNNSCTKCHGTGTVTVTASNYEVVAPSGVQADTGQVSTGKIGAHQTHLKYFNGLSQQGSDSQARCQICHTVPGTNNHANANSTPVFTGLALGTGTYATSYNAGTCAVYCHNPTGTGGTLAAGNAPTVTTAAWTDAAYITDGTPKTDANCNKCHKSPNGSNIISATISHAGYTIATACTPCHAHEGGIGGATGRQHMDGAKWGSGGAGGCVGCHGYEAGTWAAAPVINAEGKGAHDAHITYLTTKRFTITLAPLTDTFGGATTAWTNVCGVCHSGATHTNGSVEVSVSSTYLFGTGSTLYSGIPGTLSAANAKTCSNISCHYFTTPVWSAP